MTCKTVHELRTCLKVSTHDPHPHEPAHQTLRTHSTTQPWPHAWGHVRQVHAGEDKGVKTAVGAHASTFSPGLTQGPHTWHIQNICDIVPNYSAYKDQGISAYWERINKTPTLRGSRCQTDLTGADEVAAMESPKSNHNNTLETEKTEHLRK